MPEHFRTRNDMINWLVANCPRKAIVHALDKGKVEFLGGFTSIPPSNLPGWIFKVTSKQVQNVCILANDKDHKYEIRIIKRIPWKNWDGVWHGIGMKHSLNSGDHPLAYKELFDAEKSRRSSED